QSRALPQHLDPHALAERRVGQATRGRTSGTRLISRSAPNGATASWSARAAAPLFASVQRCFGRLLSISAAPVRADAAVRAPNIDLSDAEPSPHAQGRRSCSFHGLSGQRLILTCNFERT